MLILPIAGGKGGVGKSLVAANLAVAIGQSGRRVVLADLDLGASNQHLMLGIPAGQKGIGTFLTNPKVKFEDVILQTEYKNLRFIPGDAEIPGMANLGSGQKKKLIRRLGSIDSDFLILDIGAGTSYNVIDFFLMSGHGIVVTNPTPIAIVNAYLFLKNAVFRIIQSSFGKKSKAAEYLETLRKDTPSLQKLYVPALIENIRSLDPTSYNAYQEAMSHFHPRIILNMLQDPKDSDRINRLRISCQQYLGLNVEHLGIAYRDDLQDVALNSRLPILAYKPNSVLSQALYRIADKITQIEDDPSGPLTKSEVETGYNEAEMEAAADFESKMDYIEDLLHSGALSTGDLVETIKNQQIEISHLKKENTLYKSKLVKAMHQGYRP
ncbi:MAG: P-loop NTPase [Spirochaetia bacterium]